ncbi:MAG: STAS domain-containing protein [Zoogloeaceae bacterium]|jgi:SulP family sulfate permease|nr:STAS domain-containing protein [Zoogloeaceae bacterium]
MKFSFRPKLFDVWPHYNRAIFARDVSAGITVGVLALPLAMAFAIASGMPPGAGIWTAIVAGFLISLLGGSRVQIGGPTGAFIPIVYGIVATLGVHDLLIATMMSGVLLFALGLLRLGGMIRFIPRLVVIGFTSGIAIVIFLSQIKEFLGLPIDNLPGEFFAKIRALYAALPHLHTPTLALSIASLAVLLAWNRKSATVAWMRRLPGPLAVLIIFTLLNAALDALPLIGIELDSAARVATIGSRFNGIPHELPPIGLPELTLGTLGKLFAPALAIALLGAIESLLSARIADNMIDDRHDPDQELMAQGVANFIAPLFGGFAATGAIARTATNVRSGGQTPVAGIIHSLVLLLIVLVLAPLASHIPLATLSAIVVMVAVNMGEWRALSPRELARYSNTHRVKLLGTMLITVIFDLTLAIEIGMGLASLFFIYHTANLTKIEPITIRALEGAGTRVRAYRIFGALFFGVANKMEDLLLNQPALPEVMLLDMDKVINIDTTGLDILRTLHRNLNKQGARLIFCGLNKQPNSIVRRSGFREIVGAENIFPSIQAAIAHLQPNYPNPTKLPD